MWEHPLSLSKQYESSFRYCLAVQENRSSVIVSEKRAIVAELWRVLYWGGPIYMSTTTRGKTHEPKHTSMTGKTAVAERMWMVGQGGPTIICATSPPRC